MQNLSTPVQLSYLNSSSRRPAPARRVLVTGGAGYIGSHTVLALADAGFEVAIADDLSTGSDRLVPEGIQLHVGNIGNRAFISTLLDEFKPDAIIHFAGSLSVPESVVDPLKYYTNNFVNTCTLVEAALAAGVNKLIFSSTAAVYGSPENACVSEEDETRPINPYGRSKLMVEDMLKDVSVAHPFRYVALRYFNVAGADGEGRTGQIAKNSSNLIKVVSELATGRRNRITVYGGDYTTSDGTCIRDFIHVTDLANAHVAALHYLLNAGVSEVINCGYGNGYSVLNVLRVAGQIVGQDLDYVVGPRRQGDPAQVIADPTRAHSLLAWTPRHDDLELILRTAIAWEKSLIEDAPEKAVTAAYA